MPYVASSQAHTERKRGGEEGERALVIDGDIFSLIAHSSFIAQLICHVKVALSSALKCPKAIIVVNIYMCIYI